jgi:hypothetical protein
MHSRCLDKDDLVDGGDYGLLRCRRQRRGKNLAQGMCVGGELSGVMIRGVGLWGSH